MFRMYKCTSFARTIVYKFTIAGLEMHACVFSFHGKREEKGNSLTGK